MVSRGPECRAGVSKRTCNRDKTPDSRIMIGLRVAYKVYDFEMAGVVWV